MEDDKLIEFVDSLNLPFEGELKYGKEYYVEVSSSNDFSKLFDCISLNDSLTLEDNSRATVDDTKFTFTNGEYDVVLEADYNDDVYFLKVEQK